MLPKPHLTPVTLLIPQAKPDPYNPNPEAGIPDWDAPPAEVPLRVSWLNQPARLEDDPTRHMVAWCARIGVPGHDGDTIQPGWRVRRETDRTVWHVVSVTPASSSPFTGWTPGSVADLEMPVG